MCTKEESKKSAEEAIEETLFTPDPHGHTRFAREVHDAVFENGADGSPSRFQRELRKGFYETFGKWFFGGGAVVLLGLAGLYFQIQQHEKQLNEGGRYTEDDAIEDRRIQEGRDQRQDKEIQGIRDEIRSGFSELREAILNNR